MYTLTNRYSDSYNQKKRIVNVSNCDASFVTQYGKVALSRKPFSLRSFRDNG